MPRIHSTLITRFAALGGFCLLMLTSTQAAVPGMKVLKVVSPEPGANRNFGSPCVLTDRYAVVADSSEAFGERRDQSGSGAGV